MLYQTQQHIHTDTHANITLIHSSPLTPSQFYLTMQPVVNALKRSFFHQMSHKPPLNDDLPYATTHLNVVASDDFSVDDLLDFSKMNGCESDGDENEGKSKSIVANDVVSIHATHTDAKEEIVAYRNGVVEASDICVPTDDVANLEWLSHFVEDSFTEYSLTCALPVKPTVERLPVEASGKPTKARSKRARSFSGSETTSSASSTTSFSFETTEDDPSYTAAMMKKRKFSKPSEGNKMAQNRRCSHCGVQKTPQWRAGPLGAKTLCNACGVRFKSGRLFPEYRPACSPTFSIKLHSNNHRKVLEMRHSKEVKPPETGRVPAVSIF